jgi:hypothetical protein
MAPLQQQQSSAGGSSSNNNLMQPAWGQPVLAPAWMDSQLSQGASLAPPRQHQSSGGGFFASSLCAITSPKLHV